MADEDAQFGIDRARHQDLAGRRWHVWWRRVVLSVVAALPILALLNVFGQHAGPRSVQSPDADPLDADAGCRNAAAYWPAARHLTISSSGTRPRSLGT